MKGHNVCFYAKIRKIIPKLSLLLCISLSTAVHVTYYYRETVRCRGLTIIADIRGCTTSTINTLLESLYLFEVRIFSSPGRSPGKAIVLPPVSASALAAALAAALALAKC